MAEAYSPSAEPNELHGYIAGISKKPLLIVDTWYDDAMSKALAGQSNWGKSKGYLNLNILVIG